MNNLLNEVETFLNEATYLGSADFGPLKASLKAIATEIDAAPATASLWAQFSLLYRYALDLKPKEEVVEDPLDLLLRQSAGQGVSVK